VLADQATPVEDIDVSAVQTQIQDLKEDASRAKDDREKAMIEAALAVAEAKLVAAEAPAYR
jgi:F0F1-type ATP synthase epsilon subunit